MVKAQKRLITADDLYRFDLITDLQISPDGKNVIYSVQRVERKSEKKFSNLFIVPTSGGRPKQFTYGNHSDSKPRWSPDGREIAFISNRHDEKQSQIYLIPFDGGEARKATDLKGIFVDYMWSFDSKKFLVSFIKKDKEAIEREKDEQKKKLGVVSRHITRVFYKLDGMGYLPKERLHIWVVDVKSGKGTQLTDSGIHDEYDMVWSPDGKQIGFIANYVDEPDLDIYSSEIYTMKSTGGKPKKIPTPYGAKNALSFSPDGKMIAFLHIEGKGEWWRNTRLWVVPSDGKGKAVCLTKEYDFNVSNWTINDIIGALDMIRPTWSPDSEYIYFHVARHGNTELKRVNAKGIWHFVEDLISSAGVVGNYSFSSDHRNLAYYFGDLNDPGQIYARNMSTGRDKKLTGINSNWLSKTDLGQIEEVWFKGAAKNDLHGWILKPPGFNPKRKYPAILEIHGGPQVQYGNLFMHEFYFLAASGYVVFLSNPRGGQGYGEKHAGAIQNKWGTVDFEDLMKWADYVARKPWIDSSRIGVTGGSYGGYMTNWIVGHTSRFRAAVTQRSVSNFLSMWGSSDFNWSFQDVLSRKPPWEDFANFWEKSPMKYIGNCKTPTLVIHNEMDMRCEIEQGEQVFVALKKLGVDTEFVRFPDEPHGLSRGGRTDRRIARLQHILRWFDKYLKSKKNP